MDNKKLSLEQTVALFKRYPNALFDFYNGHGSYFDLLNVGYDPVFGIIGFDSKNAIVPHKHYNPEFCRIKLKSIKDISTTDATVALKITETYCATRDEIVTLLLLFDNYWKTHKSIAISPEKIIELSDFLRSRNYNIGSGELSIEYLSKCSRSVFILSEKDAKKC